jgi:hypothetical protein
MLERPIQKGDYVVSYNNVYEVTDLLGKPGVGSTVRILLLDKSKTTKSVRRSASECCIIDAEDVLIWKIKRGY